MRRRTNGFWGICHVFSFGVFGCLGGDGPDICHVLDGYLLWLKGPLDRRNRYGGKALEAMKMKHYNLALWR